MSRRARRPGIRHRSESECVGCSVSPSHCPFELLALGEPVSAPTGAGQRIAAPARYYRVPVAYYSLCGRLHNGRQMRCTNRASVILVELRLRLESLVSLVRLSCARPFRLIRPASLSVVPVKTRRCSRVKRANSTIGPSVKERQTEPGMAGSETCAEQKDRFGLIGHARRMLSEVPGRVAPISISAWSRFEGVSIGLFS